LGLLAGALDIPQPGERAFGTLPGARTHGLPVQLGAIGIARAFVERQLALGFGSAG
jgi:hypothetical protein